MGEPAEAVEVKVVETKQRNSEVGPWEGLPGALEQRSFERLVQKKKSLRARYLYGIVFLFANLVAWCVRDYGQKVTPQLHYLKSCGIGGLECFHTMGVLRVSLGCFIFFFIMFLTTCNTSKLYETRNTWHSRWWPLKFIMLIVSLTIPFFLPSNLIQLYGELARVGAGVFLILQLVSVIEFITWWNNYWMPDETGKQSFAFSDACHILTFKEQVNRGLLSSGIMASYIVFLCWSAIRSEPAAKKCSPQKHENEHGDWTTVLGFLIAIFAIVIATFSTGIDSQTFQFRKDEVQHEDDIPYKYGFFHLIFSLGAMYFAMLFISWNLDSSTRKWSIDVGWASTWVKIVNEWFAATIYIWKLIYPVVRQTKVMDQEEPVQQAGNSVL
ncbi:probable serine incorporator isoform X2 [Camellia sinensis]|uniref:probable serine incorporator isoform X2 n=1 Tax=Camellia sinensis TaxID=4442 RepID=UPI001036C95F|nr:probable serine incorporator isoform X2 [Camellia sinensis]